MFPLRVTWTTNRLPTCHGADAPCVIEVCDEGLTPAEAREMAERLWTQPGLGETWTVTWNRDLKRNSSLARPCRIGRTPASA